MSGQMRIVLVNPNPMKPPVTPISLDYLGAAYRHAGINVDLVDCVIELDCAIELDWRKKLSDVLTEKPVLVGVTLRNIDNSYFVSQDNQKPFKINGEIIRTHEDGIGVTFKVESQFLILFPKF
jgi:hypothetical protein